MNLGQKINYAAKAVAAFLVALVSLFTAIFATLPQESGILLEYAVWIQSALAFLTTAAVWLTTNGPKVETVFDTVEDVQDALGSVGLDIDDVIPRRGNHRE